MDEHQKVDRDNQVLNLMLGTVIPRESVVHPGSQDIDHDGNIISQLNCPADAVNGGIGQGLADSKGGRNSKPGSCTGLG